jgi:uncharacterized OB-fold protein
MTAEGRATTDIPEVRITGGIAADDEYWQALGRGEFRLCQCAECHEWMWPAHFRCGKCGSWDQQWVQVEPEGTVYSWTRTWYAFDRTKERAEDLPYVIVLAELPHAGCIRVLGVLKEDDSRLHIGAKVKGSIDPPSPKTKNYPALHWVLAE